MGSTLRRLKVQLLFKWANARTRSTVAVLSVAAFLFYLVPRMFQSNPNYQELSTFKEILDAMPDAIPVDCRDHAYDFNRLDSDHSVSIIIKFDSSSFYDFQLTIMSVIEHTPYDLYSEIVVLQDGKTDASLKRELISFFRNPKLNKVKVFESDKHEGIMLSRFKLTAVSKGSILVYVHPTAVVNHGWLQPLLAKVIEDPTLIAVPHYDNMLDGNVFETIDRQLINVFTWSLATVSIESPDVNDADLLDSPVMRGDVFVVQKSFVEQIGGFDDRLLQTDGVGNHIELSLRTWRCGGAIRIVKCSRVFVKDALMEQRVTETRDLHHIVELWFDDFQSFAYRQSHVDSTLSDAEQDAVILRRQYFKNQNINCQGFAWYLQKVLDKAVAIPSKQARYFGKLRADTGYCMKTRIDTSTDDIALVKCSEDDVSYRKEMIFEMNRKGAIFQGTWCLEPTVDGLIVLQQCKPDNPRQQWWLTNSMLTPATLPRKCLAANNNEGLLELNDCNHDSDHQQWTFMAS